MEIIEYANGNGHCIQLEHEEAKELAYLIEKALREGVAESGFINTTIEVTKKPTKLIERWGKILAGRVLITGTKPLLGVNPTLLDKVTKMPGQYITAWYCVFHFN